MNVKTFAIVALTSLTMSYSTALFSAKVAFKNNTGRTLNAGGLVVCVQGTCSYTTIDSVDNNKTITIDTKQYPKVMFDSTIPTKISSSDIDLTQYTDGTTVTLNLSGSNIVVK